MGFPSNHGKGGKKMNGNQTAPTFVPRDQEEADRAEALKRVCRGGRSFAALRMTREEEMEKTIRFAAQQLRADLDRLERDAMVDLKEACTPDEELATFWRYAQPILEISNVFVKHGLTARGRS